MKVKTETIKAIETLCSKITDKTTSDEALKFTQAILNLVNSLRAGEDSDGTKLRQAIL